GSPLVVDVIAHSRGGLVARELVERLCGGPLQVRSLLLAGTPNLGTPLADADNLVSCVNRLTNLLTLIPNPIVGIADPVIAVMTEVVGQAFDALPGITAMRPPSPGDQTYLAELDALGRPADVAYRLIGSDYQPQSGSKLGNAFEGWTLDAVLQDKA